MKTVTGLFLLLASLTVSPASAEEPLFVGVLEEPQCLSWAICRKSADPDCEKNFPRMVRIPFVKTGDGWVDSMSFDDIPGAGRRRWTTAFDGRNLGSLETQGPADKVPGQLGLMRGLQDIAPGQTLPEIAGGSEEFSGQCTSPRYRPLILVSQPNFRDLDRWKPFQPDGSQRKLVAPLLRDIVERQTHCFPDTIKAGAPHDFNPDELVLHKSYRDQAGRELVTVEIRPKFERCEFDGEHLWTNHWFLIDGGEVRYLGNEMELIDAGDYDGDGRSEVVFWHGNSLWWGARDGYTLFHDDFQKRINHWWKSSSH